MTRGGRCDNLIPSPPDRFRRDAYAYRLLRADETAMPAVIQCTQCQRQLNVLEAHLGALVRCPVCKTMFTAVAVGGGRAAVPMPPAPTPHAPKTAPAVPMPIAGQASGRCVRPGSTAPPPVASVAPSPPWPPRMRRRLPSLRMRRRSAPAAHRRPAGGGAGSILGRTHRPLPAPHAARSIIRNSTRTRGSLSARSPPSRAAGHGPGYRRAGARFASSRPVGSWGASPSPWVPAICRR